jgi:serine/threonine-protein kinase
MPLEMGLGTRLGRFELLAAIGRGGSATVWAARVLEPRAGLAPIVAVKVLRPEVEQEASFRQMLVNEGHRSAAIEHEHVVRVHELGADEQGHLYLAMEWVDGDSLARVVKIAALRGPIPWELSVKLVSDIASGLAAIHNVGNGQGGSLGLVHCDVSPHNVLVGEDGSVKVTDLGVASTAQDDVGALVELRGKFAYMSPEQTRGEPLDRRSDLFSLGIVLFELTTGQRLFRGASPRETLERVLGAEIPNPSALRAGYPAMLELIVKKALNRNPEHRFQNAEDFQHALDALLRSERIVVARGGIGSLVRRVLGSELSVRRERIRACLVALESE